MLAADRAALLEVLADRVVVAAVLAVCFVLNDNSVVLSEGSFCADVLATKI